MSSMWRAAVIVAVLLATAPPSSAQYARSGQVVGCARHQSEHRVLARELACASPKQQLPLLRLCWLPDRQSGLAGCDADARLGREGDAARRECGDGPRLLRCREAAGRATAGRALPMPTRRLGGSAQALDAARHAWSLSRPQRIGRADDLGPLSGRASPEPTPMRGSMLCCSPRGLTTRRASWRW